MEQASFNGMIFSMRRPVVSSTGISVSDETLAYFFIISESERQQMINQRRCISTKLHGVISHHIVILSCFMKIHKRQAKSLQKQEQSTLLVGQLQNCY